MLPKHSVRDFQQVCTCLRRERIGATAAVASDGSLVHLSLAVKTESTAEDVEACSGRQAFPRTQSEIDRLVMQPPIESQGGPSVLMT